MKNKVILFCLILTATSAVTQSVKSSEGKRDSVYKLADQMPCFPGGEDSLRNFINLNIQYPAIAFENDIQGRVNIECIISKNGSVRSPKVVKSIGFGCDEEAMRLVSVMPNWKIGTVNGEPVNVKITIGIKFQLPHPVTENSYIMNHYYLEDVNKRAQYKDGKASFLKDIVTKLNNFKITDTSCKTIWFVIYISETGAIDSLDLYSCPDKELSKKLTDIIPKLGIWTPAQIHSLNVKSKQYYHISIENKQLVFDPKSASHISLIPVFFLIKI
jgi:TonB family protein